MSFANLNKVVANFTNVKKDLPFKKIDKVDLSKTYKVNGIFLAKTKFGDGYFVSVEDNNHEAFNVSLPKGQNDTCYDICHDPDLVNAINRGECGIVFSIYYSKKYDKNCTAVTWTDLFLFNKH